MGVGTYAGGWDKVVASGERGNDLEAAAEIQVSRDVGVGTSGLANA